MLLWGCSSRQYSDWAQAANSNDIQSAKIHISNNQELGSADLRGDIPLQWAARSGHLDVVESLIDGNSVDIDTQNRITGETALMLAVAAGHLGVVRLLLDNDANLELRDNSGNSARDLAALKGDSEALRLIERVLTGSPQKLLGTSVVSAVYSGNLDAVKILAKERSSLSNRDSHGETPFVAVAKTGNVEIADYLFEFGADSAATDRLGRTPVILAVQAGHTELVLLFIARGVDAGSQSFQGHPALVFAVANHQVDMVALLLINGADANAHVRQNQRLTPLMVAAQGGYLEIAAVLLAADARVDSQTDSGDSALLLAAAKGHVGVVSLFLQAGADPNLDNVEGFSPVVVAAQREEWFVVSQLLAAGIELSERQHKNLNLEPQTASGLYEMIGRHQLQGGEIESSLVAFDRSIRAYKRTASKFSRHARFERVAAALVVFGAALADSTKTYLQAEHYRERASEHAKIAALANASTTSEYATYIKNYKAHYERAARIAAVAEGDQKFDWLLSVPQGKSSYSQLAEIATRRADLVINAVRCIRESTAEPAKACATQLAQL